ncbi:MAG: AI-2E family transporter [Bacteroidales bacterium]|nr:AI-2E family transporter [Bacteroidales bacterium]
MENRTNYSDKLAKYVIIASCIGIIGALCWYFSSVIVYVLAAVVVSLIAKPVMGILRKIKIKGRKFPDWLLAAICLITVLGFLISVVTMIVPIVNSIIKGISIGSIENAARHIALPLSEFNGFLISAFPNLGEGFRIETALMNELQKLFDVSAFSSFIGSAASFITDLGIAMFSIVFISYFFIKDDGLFTEIITALVPDRHEKNAREAISDIGHLLSRYFIGVMVEVTGVALINFIGLWAIARLSVDASLAIAFLTGLLNIIPYVGPLVGGVLGTILGLIIKYSSAVPVGLDVSFLTFTIILIAIFCFTQLIDNFLYQPVIYSTSIKAKPLEIFIVLLIVGHIGGPLSMIVAIPCYTVVRVIAFRFFRHIKAIDRLIPEDRFIKNENKTK